MNKDMNDLFKEEIQELAAVREICLAEDAANKEFVDAFKKLVATYEKNLKFMMKLTSISDSQQNYLQQVQGDLKKEVDERKKAEAALRHSNKIIQTVLDNIEALVFVVEGVGNGLLFINKYARKVFDIKDDKSCGSCLDEVFLSEVVNSKNKTDSSVITEVKCEKNGRWYNVSSSQINWIDGKNVFLQVGMDITDRKQAEGQLAYYAYTDPMTGVSNRRTGLMILERALNFAIRQQRPLSVCYIDVDGLKKVNDEYGHAQGDYLIQTVSGIIKSALRETDLISRLGGDEFLLVFPDCNLSDAELVMERINQEMENHDQSSDKPFKLSISFGIVDISEYNKADIDEIIKKADERMYMQKLSKR